MCGARPAAVVSRSLHRSRGCSRISATRRHTQAGEPPRPFTAPYPRQPVAALRSTALFSAAGMRAAAGLCCLLLLGTVSNADAKRKSRVSGLAKAARASVVSVARQVGAGPKDVVIYRNGERMKRTALPRHTSSPEHPAVHKLRAQALLIPRPIPNRAAQATSPARASSSCATATTPRGTSSRTTACSCTTCTASS